MLGHLGYGACRAAVRSGAVEGIALKPGPDPPPCLACARAKVTNAVTPRTRTSERVAADRVCHIDLAGPTQASYHGSTYFAIAVWRDYICVYGLKSKDDVGECIEQFLHFVERQSHVSVRDLRVVRTDGHGEFLTPDFRELVAAQGLRHQHSVPYRSSQNGVAERAIRTVTEMAYAMMLDAKHPHYLWEDALRHAAYVRNRLPRRGATSTPFETFFGCQIS